MAPVISTLVSRRLVFLIRFATREHWLVSKGTGRKESKIGLATNSHKQNSGKVHIKARGKAERTYTANPAAAGAQFDFSKALKSVVLFI
jgi:hypothetical protein